MAIKASRWLKLFETFIADIRIVSKEVTTAGERGAPLVLWESQRRFIQEIGQGLDDGIHKFFCLKSRQLGVTTVSLAIDVFWLALHPNIIGCLVSDTPKNSNANRLLIENYVKSFPDGYFGDRFKIEKSNRDMLLFSNGARLDLLVAGIKDKGTSWGEGIGYTFAHLTEVAAYGSVEGLKSLEEGFAQQNPDRLFIYESTAKGFNHWRTRWLSGMQDRLTQRSFFVGWWAGDTNRIERKDARFSVYGVLPPQFEEREMIAKVARDYGHKITAEQLAWLRWKGDQAGAEQDLLEQNQPSTADEAFVQTGYSFFQTRMVTEDMKRLDAAAHPYRAYRYEVDGDFFNFTMHEITSEDDLHLCELKVWEEPVDDGQYVIGFDPAYGRNPHKDHHCIQVWRCFADRVVQVAEYVTCDVETKHASWVLFHLCAAYRNCMANVELGGPGQMVMTEFDHLRQLLGSEMNAGKVAAKGWDDAGSNVRWYLYHRPDSFGAGYLANFETTWRTKQMIMHQLRGAYVSREIDMRSISLLKEMSIVVVNDGEIGAPESRNEDAKDDRVFAMALSVRAWLDWVRKDMMAQGLTYEAVMAAASGQTTPVARTVNSIVYGFLRRQEELAEQPAPRGPEWKEKLGLI